MRHRAVGWSVGLDRLDVGYQIPFTIVTYLPALSKNLANVSLCSLCCYHATAAETLRSGMVFCGISRSFVFTSASTVGRTLLLLIANGRTMDNEVTKDRIDRLSWTAGQVDGAETDHQLIITQHPHPVRILGILLLHLLVLENH